MAYSRGEIVAWLKPRAVLHVARRDEQTIRRENVQYLSDSSILNHRR